MCKRLFPPILLIFQLIEDFWWNFLLKMSINVFENDFLGNRQNSYIAQVHTIRWPNGDQQTITIPSSWKVLKSQISCLSISKLIGWTPIIEFFLDEQIVLMHWLFLQKEDFDRFDGRRTIHFPYHFQIYL